jgi:hypothetical protein
MYQVSAAALLQDASSPRTLSDGTSAPLPTLCAA